MPNYDYECVKCDQITERNVSIEEREAQVCANCNGPMIRQWSFKGAVWSPTKNGGHS